MGYGYIVNNNGIVSIYNSINGRLIKRDIQMNAKGRAECIAENIGEDFSVTLRNNQPIIIVRSQKGEIIMLSEGESRVIQKNITGNSEVYVNLIMNDRAVRLIYLNGYSLITKGINKEGNEARVLDTLRNIPYRLIEAVEGGYILLYKRINSQRELGYREITANGVGEFKEIFSTGFDIGDFSACCDGENLHFVFVSASRFAVRVMYVRRGKSGFTGPKNLWEGSRCGTACIAAEGDKVYVWWESGGNLFQSVSHNSGESFRQCVRGEKLEKYKKVLYLEKNSFGITELMLSENEDIYGPDEVKDLIFKNSFKLNEHKSNEADLINRLKEELNKKQEEIERLSNTLLSKNQEASKMEYTLRQKCKELATRLEQMQTPDNTKNE